MAAQRRFHTPLFLGGPVDPTIATCRPKPPSQAPPLPAVLIQPENQSRCQGLHRTGSR
ncbi:hypothetical protein HanIR_Chr04g0170541 [Helianthus annuus]|nr:hypothetical protein HanIR_Chr04g0170541 [Helianthus annuus]